MITRRHIIFILIGFLYGSCDPQGQYSYPNDKTYSSETGEPQDSLALYFPLVFKSNEEGNETFLDTFLIQRYSSTLFAFKEPILYNYYLGHKSYRFLWLRNFHNPVVISINHYGHNFSLTTKVLDGQINISPYPLDTIFFVTPDNVRIPVQKANMHTAASQANIIFNETRVLSSAEWEQFDRLLTNCDFWSMNPTEETLWVPDSEWIIEAHLKNNYLFVFRNSPENCFHECGKYLIDLSGLKEEIY